jgi:mannose-6-phosphate isomerase-like protein (cupin superfamily)
VLSNGHHDSRRTLTEVVFSDRSVQNFDIHAVLPLGNHYHEKKDETFVVIEGSGTLALQQVDPITKHGGEITRHTIVSGSVILIRPWTAHTFWMITPARMIGYSSTPYNEEDNDLIPWTIEEANASP